MRFNSFFSRLSFDSRVLLRITVQNVCQWDELTHAKGTGIVSNTLHAFFKLLVLQSFCYLTIRLLVSPITYNTDKASHTPKRERKGKKKHQKILSTETEKMRRQKSEFTGYMRGFPFYSHRRFLCALWCVHIFDIIWPNIKVSLSNIAPQ